MTATEGKVRLTKAQRRISKMPLNPEANTCPSGYSMDLYCDRINPAHAFEEFPHSYLGETYGECAQQAREHGWRLYANAYATCPKCTGRQALSPEREGADG